jgi:hypothetical protein
MNIKQGKTRKVSRAHVEDVCREPRIGTGDVMSIARCEILHSDRLCDLPIERVEDLPARRCLIDVAERIEIPIVVIPKGARGMGAAPRSLLGHTLGLVGSWMVNARTRLEQVAHRRLLLHFG